MHQSYIDIDIYVYIYGCVSVYVYMPLTHIHDQEHGAKPTLTRSTQSSMLAGIWN